MGSSGADLPPAVGRVGQTVRALQGLCLIAVDEIALLPCAQLRQRGAGKISTAPAGIERLPADVRHPLGAAVRIGAGDFDYPAGDQPQPLMQAEFLRLVKQHLHTKADTQQRRTGSGLLPDRLDQAQLFQPGHAVPERPDPRQHQRIGAQHLRRVTRQQRFCPEARKGMLHAEQVGQAVINDRHLHTLRTSTPPARMSSFSSCTVSFL